MSKQCFFVTRMKAALIVAFSLISLSAYAQNQRAELDRQMEEIMKAREEMIKSLLNDSSFQNFDDRFEDMVKKFQQSAFGNYPDLDSGAVVGEYDWRETATHKILVLKVKQIKDKPLDIKIEKGQIKLKGDVESVSEDKGQRKQISKVHFERSFSIPDGVDQNSPEFESVKGELHIKFKKLNSTKTTPKNKAKTKEDDGRVPVQKEEKDEII